MAYFLEGRPKDAQHCGERDVVNKIGGDARSAARDNGVPAYAVLPTSSIDFAAATAGQIPIEERDPAEVLEIQIRGELAMPLGATALNPAFDVRNRTAEVAVDLIGSLFGKSTLMRQ
jgi:methylthioribose-1-phosphate isomerase